MSAATRRRSRPLSGSRARAAGRAELGDVEVAARRLQRRPEAPRLARDLAEVAQLLGRERREPFDEAARSGYVPTSESA